MFQRPQTSEPAIRHRLLRSTYTAAAIALCLVALAACSNTDPGSAVTETPSPVTESPTEAAPATEPATTPDSDQPLSFDSNSSAPGAIFYENGDSGIPENCGPEDYSSGSSREECINSERFTMFHPSGVSYTWYTLAYVADPFLEAHGFYSISQTSTPEEYMEYLEQRYENAIATDAHTDRLQQPVSASILDPTRAEGFYSKVLPFSGGDFLEPSEVNFSELIDDKLYISELRDIAWMLSPFDATVTVKNGLVEIRLGVNGEIYHTFPNSQRITLSMPGDIVETNGRVSGNSVSWGGFEGDWHSPEQSELYVVAKGFNVEAISEILGE